MADAVVDDALGGWGTPAGVFPPEVRTAYVQALRRPEHAHAICEEYRAAASLDREHDRADVTARRRIACPLLVLWSAKGPLETWYDEDGDSEHVELTAVHTRSRSLPDGAARVRESSCARSR